MKRQDIISKLMNEGFSQKTLVNLTDKQLHMLAERILSEQYATTGYGATTGANPVNVSKTDTGSITSLKQQKKPFVTYEGEMTEQGKLGEPKKKEKTDKELALQRITHKIESKMKKNECIKTEVELLKRMKENVPEKYEKYIEKRMGKVKAEKEPVAENKKLKKWVSKLVESKYFSSKADILKTIQDKLDEQELSDVDVDVDIPDFLTYDAIKSSGTETKPAQPTTKPGTKPGTKPIPKTPFQPGPGPKHNPKASVKESKK